MGRDGPRVRGCCWGLARVSPGVGALRGRQALWAGRGCCPACRTGGRGVSRPGHPGLLALQQAGAPGQQGNTGLSPTVLSPGARRWPCCPGHTDRVEAASIQHATFPGQPGSRGCVEPGAAFCNEPSGGAEGGSRGSSACRVACPGPAAGRESPDTWQWPAPGPALPPMEPEGPHLERTLQAGRKVCSRTYAVPGTSCPLPGAPSLPGVCFLSRKPGSCLIGPVEGERQALYPMTAPPLAPPDPCRGPASACC